jgi:hypothetical protein
MIKFGIHESLGALHTNYNVSGFQQLSQDFNNNLSLDGELILSVNLGSNLVVQTSACIRIGNWLAE